MSKRGPKSWEDSSARVMPMEMIAARLKVSVRTVQSDYSSAVKKLKRTPGAVSGLLRCVQAVAELDRDLLRAGSAECRPEFVALWNGKRAVRRGK
jgi:hypothetical protein